MSEVSKITKVEFQADPAAAIELTKKGRVDIMDGDERVAILGSTSPWWTPTVPCYWDIYPAGPINHTECMYDEDLFGASYKLKDGEVWSIWIDGGKGISKYRCALVVDNDVANHDTPEWRGHRNIMIDYLDDRFAVQDWIDRAVVICEKWVNMR